MSAGFRYTLRVPEFTREERSPDEIVVTFQVDILIQMPGSQEPSAPTSVWRRFSEFRQLFMNLKGAFPEIFQEKSMEPPPKRKFRSVNSSDKLLEERRRLLEQWLWKLLRFPEVAQSRDMKLFLQLELATRAANVIVGVHSPRHMQEFGSPEEGSEPDTDASSMLSVPTTAYSQVNGHSSLFMSALRSSPPTAITDRAEGTEPLRMGIRVEQRSDLKNVIGALSAYVDKASYDLHEVVEENEKLKQENLELAEKLSQAESALSPSTESREKDGTGPAVDSAQCDMDEAKYSRDDAHRLNHCQVQTDPISGLQENANQEAVEKLKQEIEVLNKELADKKSQMDVGKAKFKQDNRLLAKEVARLRESNKELDADLSTLRQAMEEQPDVVEVEVLKANIVELEEKLKKGDQNLEETKTTMETANIQESEEQKARITQLTEACKALEKDRDMLSEQKSELDRLLQAANEQALLVGGQLEDTTKRLEDQCSQYNQQSTLTEKQKEALGDLDAKIQQLEKEKAALEKELGANATERNQLAEEVNEMYELKEKVQSLQSELTASSLEVNKLANEKIELEKVKEQGMTETSGELQALSQEIQGVREENGALAAEKQEVQDQCSRLVEELSLLRDQSADSVALKAEIEHLNLLIARLTEENNALQTSMKDAGMYELVIADLTDKVSRLESENEGLRGEKAGLETQIQNLSRGCELDSEKVVLLEERTLALNNALGEVGTLKEKLNSSRQRFEDAEGKVLALTKEIQELEANVQNAESASSEADRLTIAHTAEVLKLQTELDSLRSEYANLKNTIPETNEPQRPGDDYLMGMKALMTEIHGDISRCTGSVPSLSGQVPLDADIATDLMEKVADCNGKLQLTAGRVDDIRSFASSPSKAVDLSSAVADVVSDLIAKCREVNEIRVDQFLSRCETTPDLLPNQSFGEPPKTHKKNSFSGLNFPDLGQARRSIMPRGTSTSGQAPDQDRAQVAEGDSRVKKFWGGVGSRMSAKSQGLMNFMQRGQLQTGLLDDNPSEDSSIQPPTSQ